VKENTLLRSFYRLLSLTFLSSIFISFMIFFTPLNQSLVREKTKEFENTVNIKATTNNFVLLAFTSMAQSLGSRSAIRQKLLEYHMGSIGLTELVSFTTPKYKDGVVNFDNLIGASRFLPDGTLITSYGDVRLPFNHTHVENGMYILSDSDTLIFLVIAMIEEKGLFLGYDACIFDARVMLENDTEIVDKFSITDIPQRSDANILTMATPLNEGRFYLVARANEKAFKDATKQAMILVSLYSFTLFLFISILSYFTFFKFVRKLINEHVTDNGKIANLLSDKERILQEVHHRIKNNMSTIYGLLLLQVGTLKEPKAITALEDSANRVKCMMMLYDKLYKSADFIVISVYSYLPPLIDEICANFPGADTVVIHKDIADFSLNVKKLQPLGIILNELLTNVMKYAFIGRPGGEIAVSASLKDDLVTVIVADDGNGMPESIDFDNSTGFGLVLVRGLTQQLGGSIRIERGKGTRIVLEFGK